MSHPSTMPPEQPPLPTATDPMADGPVAAPQRAYGRAVGAGFSWLTLSFAAGKALSFIAQIALGILLLDEDFGVFAIATSVATFAKVFHDGGVAQLLIQRGPERFGELSGPTFWMGMTFSLAAGVLLAICAPIAGYVYGDSELATLLWIIALSLPLAAPGQVQRAKLRMDLRFRPLALISVGSYAIRHLGSVGLAYQGFGARSFVLPLLAVALFEDFALLAAARERVWRYAPRLALWKGIIGDSAWVVTSTFFQGFLLYGDYLVLGLLLPTAVVGQYFFGYQFTQQISALMAVNLIYVLMPVLSRLASDPSRQALALLRTCRVSVMVLSMLSLGFAVVVDPLETLIWKNKWDAVVPLMQVFAVAAPLRIFTANIQTMLNARGQFRSVAWLSLLEGVVYMAAAAIAGLVVGTNLAPLAALIAMSHVAFNLILSVAYMHRWGVEPVRFLKAILPGWLIAVLCAAAAHTASQVALHGVVPLGILIFNGLLFCILYVGMMRAVYAPHLSELIAIIPHRVAKILRRLIWLGEAQATASRVAEE